MALASIYVGWVLSSLIGSAQNWNCMPATNELFGERENDARVGVNLLLWY